MTSTEFQDQPPAQAVGVSEGQPPQSPDPTVSSLTLKFEIEVAAKLPVTMGGNVYRVVSNLNIHWKLGGGYVPSFTDTPLPDFYMTQMYVEQITQRAVPHEFRMAMLVSFIQQTISQGVGAILAQVEAKAPGNPGEAQRQVLAKLHAINLFALAEHLMDEYLRFSSVASGEAPPNFYPVLPRAVFHPWPYPDDGAPNPGFEPTPPPYIRPPGWRVGGVQDPRGYGAYGYTPAPNPVTAPYHGSHPNPHHHTPRWVSPSELYESDTPPSN
jgi:hypothetical protein